MDAKEQQRKFVDDEIRKRHQDLQELDQEFLEKRPELDNLKKEIGEKTRTLEDLRDQIRKWNETVEKRKSEIGQYGEARNVVGSRESTACGVEETDVGPGSNYEEKHRQCRERIKHDEDRLAAMKGTLSKLEEEQYRVSAAAYVTLWGSWALSKEGWKRAEALARFASTKAVEVARDWERFETEQSVMQKVWLECEESRQRGERARERYELLFKGLQSKEEEAERCLDQLENRERELAERGKRLSGEELKLERRAAELDELSCQMTRERDRQDAILKQQVKDNENTLRNERDSLQREKTKLQEQIETQTAQLNQDREALQKEQERIDRLRAEAEKKMFDASERETGVNAIVDRAKKAQDEWATERAAQKTATDRVNKDLDGRSRQIEKQESDLHKKQAKLETDSQSFVDVQTSCTAEMKTQADLIKVFLGLKKEVKKEVRKMAWPKQSTKTGDLNSFLVELKTATKTLQDALEEFAENIGGCSEAKGMAIGDALKSVEERAEALKQEVKNLSQSKSDLDVELKQAEQALAHVRSEEAGLRTQAEESRADLAESQTELAKVTETLDEMAQRRDKLSTAIGQLQQQRESLERECTAKEQTLGVLKTQCSHMEQQIEEFDRKLQEFNTSVNECPEIIAMEKTIADKQNQLHSIKEETARQVDRFRRVEAKLERTLQWLKNNGIALDDQYVPHRSTPTYYRAGSASTLEQPSTSTTGPLTGPDTRANLDPFSAEQLRVLERTADDLLRPAEALRADALRSEALRADALRSEALRADALRSEALRSEALRSEALRSEALRSEALRSAATLRSETPHTLLRPTDHAFAHQHSSLPDNQFELLQGFRSDGTGRRLFPVHAEWATSDDQRRYGFADTATNSVAKESSIGEWK